MEGCGVVAQVHYIHKRDAGCTYLCIMVRNTVERFERYMEILQILR